MKLTVSGMSDATGTYSYLWGFYVRGFKPWHHCFKCLYGTHEKAISAVMGDGEVLLPEPTGYFYLCGVASKVSERGEKNLHLAVRPKVGSTASVTSAYGPVFVIEDAEAIEIQSPIEQSNLPEIYARCKNFRFAAQMYLAPVLGPEAPHDTIRHSSDAAGR